MPYLQPIPIGKSPAARALLLAFVKAVAWTSCTRCRIPHQENFMRFTGFGIVNSPSVAQSPL
jgi:hypothetical protein